MELSQSVLGVSPKRFNCIEMFETLDESIVAVFIPEMPINANIYKSILATLSDCMDNAVGVDFASNDGLQRGFGGVGDDLAVDTVTSFEKVKRNGLDACSANTLACNAFWPEVRLISLKFACKRRLSRKGVSHTSADALLDGVSAAKRQTREFSRLIGGRIKRKKTHKLAKLGYADFRAASIPVFPNHLRS